MVSHPAAGRAALPDLAGLGTRPAPSRSAMRVSAWPSAVVVAVLFAVSGGVLWTIGLNYEGLSGNGASKIHPATYLAILLFGWRAFATGNPVGYLVRSVERRPACAFMLVAALITFVHIVVRSGPGLAGVIDTYVEPALIIMLVAELDRKGLRTIESVIHVAMTINAVMAVGEFVSGHLVFPYRFDGEAFEWDTRSTALQGHPLANATITACYILALARGGRDLPPLGRAVMLGLQCAALVTFGGRTATVVVLVLGTYALARAALDHVRGGRIHVLAIASTLLLMTAIPLALGGLAVGGFFDLLWTRFQSDGGSAQSRVQMFDLLGQISWRDLLVGPDAAYVDSIRRVEGLELGIENPFVRTVVYQGVMITLLLTVAVVWFLWEIARNCRRGVALSMFAFVILVNSAEGIGGKTTMMTKFALIAVCLLPLEARRRSALQPGERPAGDQPDLPPRPSLDDALAAEFSANATPRLPSR